MIRRPPRSTLDRSSAASDVYKRQGYNMANLRCAVFGTGFWSLYQIPAWHEVGGVDIAVSYTHLRAHETVLDLVCRLLLEKKKLPIVEQI